MVSDDKGTFEIFDSPIIVQYFNSIGAKPGILPPEGTLERYTALTVEALSDGILDAALLVRYEATIRVLILSRFTCARL